MKYKTNRKWAGMIAILLSLAVIITLLSSKQPIESLILLVMLFFLFVSIDVFWGYYVLISNDQLNIVKSFIWKRKVNINLIQAIDYRQTFNLGESFAQYYKSLYIVWLQENGGAKMVNLPNDAFTEKTLAQIAKKLKDLNPRIELDKNTEELIKKYTMVIN